MLVWLGVGDMNPDTLRQLIANCRRTDRRSLGSPREWTPNRVRQPGTDSSVFTEAGAWEFVAEKLETGHFYEEMRLDKPADAPAVVMKIQLAVDVPLLYVKIQIGPGIKAIGRSFHYSDHY